MGERGIGKTSLLRKFESVAHQQGCIVARIDLYSGIRQIESLLALIHEELRNSCISYYSSLGKKFEKVRRFLENYGVTIPVVGGGIQKTQSENLETTFRDRLLVIWSNVKERAPAVLVMIDEAEALTNIPGALEYLRNTFSRLGEKAALYSLTISGKSGLFQSVTDKFSPLERFFSPITLLPFTSAEVSEVLEKAATRSGVKSDTRVEADIFRDSEGQPYVVQIFGFRLYEEASQKGLRAITPQILEQVRPDIQASLASQLFERRITEGVGRSGPKFRIMSKLADSSKDAFSFSEIEKLSGVRKKEGLGVYLTQLVEAGCLSKDIGTGTYSFFLRIFKEFVRKRLVSYNIGYVT